MRARFLLIPLLLAACERVEPPVPAPPAEFIIAAGDSVFWVRSDEDGIRVRGAPMLLTEVGGRFAELYVADDDYSFYDAVFVGQRLFKRDLVSGDSVQLFADTLMPVLARGYAAANPGERPLNADEQGSDNPRTLATADVIVLDVHGPWLSYEYRTDVDVIGGFSSHGVKRGVVDLRTASGATLEGLFGVAAARRFAAQGRERWRVMRDSISASAASNLTGELLELDRYSFDPRSFILTAQDREPRLRFAIAQSAAGTTTGVLELDPLRVDEPAWWGPVRESYPIDEPTGERVWRREGFALLGRPSDAPGARTAFSLQDASGTEWRLGSMPSPIIRVMWLGDSTNVPGTRDALTKAFNEAAFYSETARFVRFIPRRGRSRELVRFASHTTAVATVPRRIPKARPRR